MGGKGTRAQQTCGVTSEPFPVSKKTGSLSLLKLTTLAHSEYLIHAIFLHVWPSVILKNSL